MSTDQKQKKKEKAGADEMTEKKQTAKVRGANGWSNEKWEAIHNQKQTAKEWLKSKCLIDDGINGKDVSFDDALEALSMASAEERKNLLEKYAKLEEEAQLIGRQEAAKEIFDELEEHKCGYHDGRYFELTLKKYKELKAKWVKKE